MREGFLEITDLLWPTDAAGDLLPVRRDETAEELLSRGQRRAAAIVRRMPHALGVVDRTYLHDLALRIHYELGRLGEELQLDRRIASVLSPRLHELQPTSSAPVTVLDVGCGTGQVLRAAAAHHYFPDGVALLGVDLNPVLIAEARRLAGVEGLACRFEHGDAFDVRQLELDPMRTVVVSSGLLHHLSAADLPAFFAAQSAAGFAGFAHWDIAPCLWSTLGAWVFHQARMREAVSRHDGVMSARRAHPSTVLLAAAEDGAAEYSANLLEGARWYPRALDVLRPIVGWR